MVLNRTLFDGKTPGILGGVGGETGIRPNIHSWNKAENYHYWNKAENTKLE